MPAAAHVQSPADYRYMLTGFLPNSQDEFFYHTIRKNELFIPKGKGDLYQPDHEDETKEGNFPLILHVNDKVVGVVRLDTMPSPVIRTAAVRLVAITKLWQGQGHGRALIQELDKLARNKAFSVLVVNAARDKVDFYLRMGYFPHTWKDVCPSLDYDSVQMAKMVPYG